MSYNFKDIEEKWRAKWQEENLYRTDVKSEKEKLYLLVEFPYPSGAGLHVGHVRSYTALDIIARKRRAEGYEVLFPIGWDAFGLPAENYAIKTGIHPSISAKENIDNFRRQLKACGFSFDWDREVNTTDPAYYKWTQWIFLKLYEHGLAYKRMMPVNWCPKDKCVLANEEVIDGACERCGTMATKKDREQWMLAITKYAERLDKDLDDTTYLDRIKIQQRNWIGLSEGAEIEFKVVGEGFNNSFNVFTTRADTIFGCTYCVLAPEHKLVKELLGTDVLRNKDAVEAYVESTKEKTDIMRSAEGREKSGVKLEGIMAINPANNEEAPIYIADYVLPNYGTGAIMAVPAHDERDFAFAKAYALPLKEVVRPYVIDHVNAPRADKPTKVRTNVHAIVFDPKGKKYLIIRNQNHNWDTVVIGGIEAGEDAIEAAKREVMEETGYTDLVFKRVLGDPVQAGYFAKHKDENRIAISTAVYFELNSDKKVEIATDGENEGNEIMWVDPSHFVPGVMINSELSFWLKRINNEHELFTGDGVLVNSGVYTDTESKDARKKITESLGGKIVTKSKLRDWVFARQRYWGEPIPIVYDKEGKMYPLAESELPVVLPQVDKFEPTDDGQSPLSQVKEWVNIKGHIDDTGHFASGDDGEEFRRETDTMPQWAGSSWYFMRYIDPHNDTSIGDKNLLAKWLPVDWYNGGMEHTTLHLLYSRFWYKFLFDIGVVPSSEPYFKRTSQGMILGAGGQKMSKSLGNVINPDGIIDLYGADVLRLYEMFVGPFDQAVAWDDKAILGVRRFLDRTEALSKKVTDVDGELLSATHKAIKAVSNGIEAMSFNTSVSALMIWLNEFEKSEVDRANFTVFIKLLSAFAPYLGEEIWTNLGEKESVHKKAWPKHDEAKLIESIVTIAVQIGGKLRGTFTLPKDTAENEAINTLKMTDVYTKYVGAVEPKKIVVVQNKLINIVL